MKTCKHQKRLQIYIDGWMESSEAARFERHLKRCPVCQSELMSLEDISSSALEIVDEAPERGYWDSFFPRVLNRIISRNVTPYESRRESRKIMRLKIGAYSLSILSLAVLVILAVYNLPGLLNTLEDRGIENIEFRGGAEPRDTATASGPEISRELALRENTSPTSGRELPTVAPAVKSTPTPARAAKQAIESPDPSAVKETEVSKYFYGDLRAETEPPKLSGPAIPGEPARTEFGKINEDYRLSGQMISAGLLTGSNGVNDNAGSAGGNSEYSISGSDFGNWGYLSMPPDSGNSKEFQRFIIELELIQTK